VVLFAVLAALPLKRDGKLLNGHVETAEAVELIEDLLP
jgi:hypothetical protein